MSWLYLPASVASNSDLKRQAVSELCAVLRTITTRSKSSRPACKTGRSRTRRYGTTLLPLTGALGVALWMSLLAASRARTSVSQAGVQESQRERAPVYGPRCSESFARFDPATCSLRTCQCSLLGGSDVYSQTLPRAGTMRTGIAYQHEALAPLTNETDASLWPTPKVGGGTTAWKRASGYRGQIQEAYGERGLTGPINPNHWEWLMGFPLEWTDLGVLGIVVCPKRLTTSDCESSHT